MIGISTEDDEQLEPSPERGPALASSDPSPPPHPLTHTNVPGILAHHTQKYGHGRFSNKDSKVELLVLTPSAVCPLLLVIPFQKKSYWC